MQKINSFHATDKKLSTLINQQKNQFTKSERKLHDYIINHTEQVIYQSLTETANECQIGEATVLRFCRKLGFKGYQEFKLSLARKASTNKQNNSNTYVDKVKYNMIQTLNDTNDLINQRQLDSAIEAIYHAESVIVYGISSSGIAGLDMQNRLMRIGLNIETITDPHSQVLRANSMDSKSVIIAISLTGSTKDIIDAVQIGKDKHATVIAITNYMESPLTKFSDIILLTSAKENPLNSGSLVSKISQLFVIDLLCTGITIKDYDKAKKIQEQAAGALSNKLY